MKTKKTYLKMAALLMVAAVAGSCSKLQEKTVFTLTVTLSPQEGLLTRSIIADTGTGIATTWEVGDYIWVSYEDIHSNSEARGIVTAVDGSGNATVSVELTDPKDGGSVLFGFPYKHWKEGKGLQEEVQRGTLADINENFMAVYGNGTLSVSGSSVTIPAGVTMGADNCIWKLSFTDGTTDITNKINQLVISFGPYDEYTVEPWYPYPDAIYVSLYPQSDSPVTITARTYPTTYSTSKASITLVEGKFYCSEGLVLTAL